MPSGAKKRKAAKKKKEKGANNASSVTCSHGDDDLKHHDEKDSDGGEVSSPASQDHHNHQYPFTEGEEEEVEKREDSSSVRSFADESKSVVGVDNNVEGMLKVALDDEGVIQIDRELKCEDESESKNIKIEYVESAKESGSSRSSSSSSSSSSDDESGVVEKNPVVVENATVVDSVKPVKFLSEGVTQATDSFQVGEAYNEVVEIGPVGDSDKVLLIEEVVCANDGTSVDNSMTSGSVESGLKENGEKKLLSLNENTRVSAVVMNLGSQKKKDELVLTSEQNAAESSDRKGFAAQENEDKLLLSFNAPRVDTNSGAEHRKDSEVPECSDSQPLVASAPRPVQTTSWKSCCGLFEVLAGSNR